jgi:hypothetical protein
MCQTRILLKVEGMLKGLAEGMSKGIGGGQLQKEISESHSILERYNTVLMVVGYMWNFDYGLHIGVDGSRVYVEF